MTSSLAERNRGGRCRLDVVSTERLEGEKTVYRSRETQKRRFQTPVAFKCS